MLLFGLYFVLIVYLFVIKDQSPQKKGVEQGPQKKIKWFNGNFYRIESDYIESSRIKIAKN